MRKLTLFSILLLLLSLFPICLLAQEADTFETEPIKSIFQLLSDDNIQTITIEANFDSLIETRRQDIEHSATLSLHYKNDSLYTMKLKIRPRGVFRRRFCEIPPLRLNFDKKELKKSQLHKDFDKLKLVTHCVNDVSGDQTLLREYWTYRMYNEITPNSFKVQLLKIKYINTQSPETPEERVGFLIENSKELSDRLGGELVDSFGLTVNEINRNSYHNTTLFNYMIGNLDWKLISQRNMKFIAHPQDGIIIVPYDFDMSAMVWPTYARLNPDYQQERFEDRFCLGKFESKESLNASIENFKSKKEHYQAYIKDCELLNSNSKRNMLSYLSSFYYILGKEKRIKKAFYGYID